MFTIVKQKRVDQIEVGDIVRSASREFQTVKEWSEVMFVDVDEEFPMTRMRVFRPRTNDGHIAREGVGKCSPKELLLSSWDLVDVQSTVDEYGRVPR